MTDSQLIQGIIDNNTIVWRYICRNLKSPFTATLKRLYDTGSLTAEDWEDIFQDSCIIMMERVKEGKFEQRPGSSLFSYFIEIGKNNVQNALRKQKKHHPVVKKEGSAHVLIFNPAASQNPAEEAGREVSAEEKQAAQNQFLDRVFDSVPTECQRIFKMFYWDHKPMDEIASAFGLRNADSAKTKKTRCMKLFKEVKDILINSGEFDEDLIKAAAERASLRELLNDEKAYCQMDNVAIAALNVDDDTDKKEDK